jgi:hypothetical protein
MYPIRREKLKKPIMRIGDSVRRLNNEEAVK